MSVPGDPAPAGHAPPPLHLRGAHVHPHLRAGNGRLRHRLLVVFGGGFLLIIGLAAIGAALGTPANNPLCHPYRPCGPPKAMQPLVNQTVWRSRRFGFSLEYPGNSVTVSQQDASRLTLNVGGGAGTILINGYSRAPNAPGQAISRQLDALTGVTQVAADTNPADLLLGGSVGYQAGSGRVSVGYLSAPQGVGQPIVLASESASDGNTTISVTVAAASSGSGPHSGLWQLADGVINSIHWPADQSDATPGDGSP